MGGDRVGRALKRTIRVSCSARDSDQCHSLTGPVLCKLSCVRNVQPHDNPCCLIDDPESSTNSQRERTDSRYHGAVNRFLLGLDDLLLRTKGWKQK